MLFISDQPWQKLDCDLLIVPCDTSGTVNRGLVYDVAQEYGWEVAKAYQNFCQQKNIGVSQKIFYRPKVTPTFLAYFPVADGKAAPSLRRWWNSLSNLQQYLRSVAVDGIAFPLCFTDTVAEEDQLEMLHAQLEDFTRGDVYNITVYRTSSTDDDAFPVRDDELLVED